jgi:NAD(P)-dependent dehydrogenase (short-subunit alcohol dehydrogenase family)
LRKTWFITGASRGLGFQIAKAALRAGHQVVAAGRQRASVIERIGPDNEQLLSVDLDVTQADQAEKAVSAAIARFGRIDVLVNNAGYGHLGLFEEMTREDADRQLATNLFGVFNVTWAALPHMRAARQGRIFNVSSLGGLIGGELASFYCASKFGLEGFSECLSKELAPFGILVTIIEPGPFRTDFLTRDSLRFGGKEVADYDQRRAQLRASFEQRSGQQAGDPAKLAQAMVILADESKPPMRFLAGSIAVNAADAKLEAMLEEIRQWRSLSVGTDGHFDS